MSERQELFVRKGKEAAETTAHKDDDERRVMGDAGNWDRDPGISFLSSFPFSPFAPAICFLNPDSGEKETNDFVMPFCLTSIT